MTLGEKRHRVNKKYEALQALAEIRDYIRSMEKHIPLVICEDFNRVAKQIKPDVSDNWCTPT